MSRRDDQRRRLPGELLRWLVAGLFAFALLLASIDELWAEGGEPDVPANGVPDDAPEDEAAPPLEEAADPEPEVDLFAELLEAQADGQWRGILNRILKEKDGAWIGQNVGALFRDRVTYGAKEACAAYTAAYLIDHPQNGKVLLGSEIVRRAHRAPAFLQALRSHLTAGEGGWERILDEARGLLASPDARSRAVGVWFLSRENANQREAVRRDILKQAKADLESLALTTDPAQRALAATYLDAFHTLLQFRFASVAEAVEVLEELQNLDLAALVLELSRRKDLPTSPRAQKLVDFGKRLVDRVSQEGHPAGLGEFLDPVRTPMPQVRRYAIQKAAQMGPKVDRVWTDLLVAVFQAEEDAEVLRGALGLVEGNRFGETSDLAAPLASAIASRLTSRGPGGVNEPDALAERVRMARAVGALRVLTPELASLVGEIPGLETDVAAALLRSLGGIAGIRVDALLDHYRRHGDAGGRDEAVRVAVVDALGRPGTRATDEDAVAAAAALREIVTGEGEAGLGRSTNAEVRQHAIRSLGSFPGPETADVLRAVSLGEDAQEASVAAVVLRKAAPKDAHAVQAIIEIARAATAAERRIEALKSLAELGKTPALETIPQARAAARELLATNAPPEVRLEAASASAALLDPEALAALAGFWSEDPARVARLAVFLDLVRALAAAGEEHDAAIVAAFEGLADTAPWKAVDDALASLVEQQSRPAFRALRARLLLAQAEAPDRTDEEARALLATADQVLEPALVGAPEAPSEDLRRLCIRIQKHWGAVAGDAQERKARLLQAVRLAAEGREKATAELVRDALAALEGDSLATLLSDEEKTTLDAARTAIEALLQG